jgi:hypothetical protein
LAVVLHVVVGAAGYEVCGYDPRSAEFLVRNPALPFPGFQAYTEEHLKVIWRSRGLIPKNVRLLRPMMLADSGRGG